MAISRAQLLKELLPGLNALFGMEYAKYGEEHAEIYESESSDRSFEEEVKLSGFSAAPVKDEGAAIEYDSAQEAYTARYTHETVAMGFSITEEAMEDNLYDSLSSRYTKALARAMAYTKQGQGCCCPQQRLRLQRHLRRWQGALRYRPSLGVRWDQLQRAQHWF